MQRSQSSERDDFDVMTIASVTFTESIIISFQLKFAKRHR